jgi:hypothetical protein
LILARLLAPPPLPISGRAIAPASRGGGGGGGGLLGGRLARGGRDAGLLLVFDRPAVVATSTSITTLQRAQQMPVA